MVLTIFWTGVFVSKWAVEKFAKYLSREKRDNFENRKKYFDLKIRNVETKEKVKVCQNRLVDVEREIERLKNVIREKQNKLNTTNFLTKEEGLFTKRKYLNEQLILIQSIINEKNVRFYLLEKEIDNLNEAFKNLEEDKKTLNSLLKIAVQQKISLADRLEHKNENDIHGRKRVNTSLQALDST